MKSSKKKPFKYERRSEDSFQKQANRSSGNYARVFKDKFKTFKCKEGDHRIRILPPTWSPAEHFSYPIWIHGSVGPDRQKYLCSQKMKGEPCPVCEEYRRASKEGDEKYAKELRPYERRVAWIIDRNDEAAGPLLYDMPFVKMDKRICAVCKDQETGETLWVDDPDKGYDIFFRREGSKQNNTDYSGHATARRPGPVSRDDDQQAEWLEFVQQNPVPDTLQFYSYDQIAESFSGGKDRTTTDDDEDDDGPVTRAEAKPKKRPVDDDEDEDEEPVSKKRPADDDDDEDEPKSKRAKSEWFDEDDEPKSKKRPVDDDDDDDEEDEPKPKKRPVDDDDDDEPKSKKRPADDDDDDDEDDEDDDEDEPKSKKRPADDDDEDDDEDEPKPKSRTRAAVDDDDDSDDEADADDDDDEPKPKKGRR